jgi:hypothetical protein
MIFKRFSTKKLLRDYKGMIEKIITNIISSLLRKVLPQKI